MEPGACLPDRKACPPTGYLGTPAQAAASQAGWSLRRRTRPRPPCHQLCRTDARRCHHLLPPWAPRGACWPADMRRSSCGGVWRPWPLACSSPSSSFCAPAVTGESQPPAGPPGTPVPRGTPPSHAGPPPPTHTAILRHLWAGSASFSGPGVLGLFSSLSETHTSFCWGATPQTLPSNLRREQVSFKALDQANRIH